MADTARDRARELLREHGTTYAEQAGITLRDKPAPLFQLLVLTTLASTRITADIAADAAAGLFAAGWRTPERMRSATWQQLVDELGKAHYKRYDESTATRLAQSAEMLIERYDGDLRRIRPGASGDVGPLRDRLREFPRIGEVGAGIFCREVQAVWPEVRPFFDARALSSARRLRLPADPGKLAALAPRGRVAELAAALVRAA